MNQNGSIWNCSTGCGWKIEHFSLSIPRRDKLSNNKQQHNAAVLDRGHGLAKDQRFIFSAANGQGRDALSATLASLIR
jgi:hypothetical protein